MTNEQWLQRMIEENAIVTRNLKPMRQLAVWGGAALLTGAIALGSWLSAPKPAIAADAALDKAAIEQIVRDYLLGHPELIQEMQAAYDQKAEAQRGAQMATAMKSNSDAIFKRSESPSVNDSASDVTVVEFFDYNCGYCRRAVDDVVKLIDGDTKVKFVFKEFPIFGKDSEAGARVALAAKLQGKYYEVHQGLYRTEGKVNEQVALGVAEKLGLDMTKLKADMVSPAVNSELEFVQNLAGKMGIQGTPHFFVGENIIPGAPEDLYNRLTELVKTVRKDGCKVC